MNKFLSFQFHLDYFLRNLRAVSEEQGKRLHEDVQRYQRHRLLLRCVPKICAIVKDKVRIVVLKNSIIDTVGLT